jgi:PadR family transcriptional regulator PadR
MKAIRLTRNVLDVLEVLISSERDAWWGFQIASLASIGTPTVYGILSRLEHAGWIRGEMEDVDPELVGRPARRLYVLTPDGRQAAVAAVRVRKRKPVQLALRQRFAR